MSTPRFTSYKSYMYSFLIPDYDRISRNIPPATLLQFVTSVQNQQTQTQTPSWIRPGCASVSSSELQRSPTLL